VDWSSVRCSKCGEEFSVERADAPILGPHDTLPSVNCPKCGGDAIPKAYLPDLVVSREKRIVIEISGAKSSIHTRSKVDFYYKHDIRWIEVTNETAKSAAAVKAICQALAISVGSSRPGRVWSCEEV
jgi:DNA-directed RNA polymerase subunit RPC12/RpoP